MSECLYYCIKLTVNQEQKQSMLRYPWGHKMGTMTPPAHTRTATFDDTSLMSVRVLHAKSKGTSPNQRCTGTENSITKHRAALKVCWKHRYFKGHSRSFISKVISEYRRSHLPATSTTFRLWMAEVQALPILPLWPSSSSDNPELKWPVERHTKSVTSAHSLY